jgi:imidazolonepropionase-like amidohydrolase
MRLLQTTLLATLLLAPAAAGAAGGQSTIAITGATVHTMGPQGTLQNATVVIENGKIRAVGTSVTVPASARRIDAHGKVVTPGLFDSLSEIGLMEVGAVEATVDNHSNDDRVTAAFRVADGINPRSMLIPVNRVEGLTRVVDYPANGKSLIAGQGAIIDLSGDLSGPEGYLIRSSAAMFASLGEAGARLGGGSRANALDYSANRAAYDRGDRRAYSLSRLDLEALVPVAKGELPLVIFVDQASDIEAALRFGREAHLKLILAGVAEGWKVAGEIAAARVPVLVNPLQDLPGSFESLGSTLENAARLHQAGVTMAFMTGDAANSRNIRQSAGVAVANGLPWDDALAAITSVPAKIWGLADHSGTLAPGQDADVVIWNGDPLELSSYPDAVFIRGREMPKTSRQLELRDRYKDLKDPTLPVYRKP